VKYSKKDFDAAVTKALKILGDNGDILAPDPDPVELIDAANELRNAANRTRNQLLKDIEAYEDGLDKVMNASKLYENKVAKDKFKLNDSNPADKKKIVQARAVLTGAMEAIQKEGKETVKKLDSTEKSLAGDIE
jgi:hypothetical protein